MENNDRTITDASLKRGSIWALANDCANAVSYAWKCLTANWGVVVVYIVYMSICTFFYAAGIVIFGHVLSMIGGLVFGIYLLAYFLEVVKSSAAGADKPTRLRANPLRWLKVFFYLLTITLIYILPLITIPLLPLAWLAVGHTGDIRALNLSWALRSAVRRPRRLLVLWCILILWIAVFAFIVFMAYLGGGFALAFLAVSLKREPGLFRLLTVCFVPIFWLMLIIFTIMRNGIYFRCIGVFGYHCEDLLTALPSRSRTVAFLVSLLLGSALSAAVVWQGYRMILDPPDWLRPSLTRIEPWNQMQEKRRNRQELREGMEHIQTLAREFCAFLDEHKRFPQSLKELIQDRRLEAGRFMSASNGSKGGYEYVDSIPFNADKPFVILDCSRYFDEKGEQVTLGIDAEGEARKVLADENPHNLRVSYLNYQPVPGMHRAGYGDPPRLFRRGIVDERHDDSAVNLQNLATDLRAYACFHNGKYPRSLEELRKAGFLYDEADVRSPGNPNRTIVYIPPPQKQDADLNYIIAYDPTPKLVYRHWGYKVELHVLSNDGIEIRGFETIRYLLTEADTPPEIRFSKRTIRPKDSPVTKSEKQFWNLRVALQEYARKHDGNFPPSLEKLLTEGFVQDKSQLSNVLGNPYVYVASQTLKSPFTNILAYDTDWHNVGRQEDVPVKACWAIHVGMDLGFYADIDRIKTVVKEQKEKK